MNQNSIVAMFALACACSLTLGKVAHAKSVQIEVPGTTMPWNYGKGLNNKRQFGNNDGTAPVVVTLASLSASPGQKLVLKYISGEVCPGGSFPCVDADGYSGFVTDHNTGNSGKYFPSRYISTMPTYLDEMVATYTDVNGKIIGKPFIVPDHGSKAIPAGATQIQIGVNDDIFSDNSGSWTVKVSTK